MGLVATFPGVVGALAFALALAAAGWVYFARPDRFQNRALAFVLVVEAFYIGAGTGFTSLTDDPVTASAFYAWNAVAGVAGLPAFLLLLSTIPSPLARPFRPRPVRLALVAAAVALFTGYFVAPGAYLAGVQAGAYAPWAGVDGWLAQAAATVALATFAYTLVAAVDAYRRAPRESLDREHARAYAVAFGVRDGGYVVTIAAQAAMGSPATFFFVAPLISIAFVALLAVGILRTQLFDMDLRVKSTVVRGLVAALFFLVFFATSELAERMVEGVAGPVIGLAAALVLAVALRPIERMAQRVADAAMPGVSGDAAYLARRKLEVYAAAVESVGPAPSPQDEAMLARLRERLGLAGKL